MTNSRDNAIGIALLFFVALCWGFVASTVKQLTATVDPYTISFFRVFLGVLVFAAVFALRKGSWRRIRWLLPWVILGALGRAGNYLLYNAGLVQAPTNAVAILAPVQTISMAILAKWIIGEGIGHKWVGLVISVGGLILIWWNGQALSTLLAPEHFWGNALLALAGVSSAVQFCSQKVLSSRFSSLEILIPVFAMSSAITFPFAWNAGGFSQSYSAGTWALLLFLGLVITGGSFMALGEGYRRCSASTAVVITDSTIFMTLMISRYVLHESVSAMMVLGAVLGLLGTVAIVWAERHQVRQQSAAAQPGQAAST